MIIPSLVRLYDQLVENGDDSVAPRGYSRQIISFRVVLNKNGSLHDIEPVVVQVPREIRKKVKGRVETEIKIDERPRPMLVPGQAKPSGSGLNPCFLWDNAAYMLGFKADDPKPERTREAFKAFRERHLALAADIKDDGFKAVCAFLKDWKPSACRGFKHLPEMTASFGVFQLRAEPRPIHERAQIRAWWAENGVDADDGSRGDQASAESLATGKRQPIARLHEPRIKPVVGAQSAGATIVSFNQDAFESYGKNQGENAPVGAEDAFKYCTALNRLVSDERHRVRISGDTYVFWSEGDAKADSDLSLYFSSVLDDNSTQRDDVTTDRLHGFMRSVAEGGRVREFGDPLRPFYILGLSPNMARLSIRLWMPSTVGEIVSRFSEHAKALEMLPTPDPGGILTTRRLVSETAPPKGGFADGDQVPPGLVAATTRAILTGAPYPRALLAGLVTRARVEGLADTQTRKDHRAAQFRRCAGIRACLTRNYRLEVPVSLDPDRNDPPYLLGRLFAVLERIQENALGNVNRTIKDSYYGTACTTPAAVFSRLLKLKNHHINKIEHAGQRVLRERELASILDRLNGFPRLLSLEQQGLFAIGYYHQRQSYFVTKSEPVPSHAN